MRAQDSLHDVVKKLEENKRRLRDHSNSLSINSKIISDEKDKSSKFVLVASCGSGKTLGIAHYLKDTYQKENSVCIFHTAKAADSFYETLLETGIPEDTIGMWLPKSKYSIKEKLAVGRSILILSHERMRISTPTKYLYRIESGTLLSMFMEDLMENKYADIFTSLCSDPAFANQSWKRSLYIDESILTFNLINLQSNNARQLLEEFKDIIKDSKNLNCNRTDFLYEVLRNPTKYTKTLIHHLLFNIEKDEIIQIFGSNNYLVNDAYRGENYLKRITIIKSILDMLWDIDLQVWDSIFIKLHHIPELSWFKEFEKIVLLDATGHLLPNYYGFNIVTLDEVPKTLPVTFFKTLQSKTRSKESLKGRKMKHNVLREIELEEKISKDDYEKMRHLDTIHEEYLIQILKIIEKEVKNGKVYVVTWKCYLPSVRSIIDKELPDNNWVVKSFGGGFGSNEYQDCEAFLMIGQYVLPFSNINSINTYHKYIDEELDLQNEQLSITHLIQEYYRTQARIYGKSAKAYLYCNEAILDFNDPKNVYKLNLERTIDLDRKSPEDELSDKVLKRLGNNNYSRKLLSEFFLNGRFIVDIQQEFVGSDNKNFRGELKRSLLKRGIPTVNGNTNIFNFTREFN